MRGGTWSDLIPPHTRPGFAGPPSRKERVKISPGGSKSLRGYCKTWVFGLSGRQVLAQDTQRGAEGDASSSTVTLGRGSGNQEVVPLQTLAPQFQGALVVCPGGEDPEVCLQIIQAVSALTGLGSDRISVCPSQP